MRVTVLLFGPEARAAGTDRVEVCVDDLATSGQVLSTLAQTCPVLQSMLAAARLAVNGAFADPQTPIRPTDELAVIGLVSGG